MKGDMISIVKKVFILFLLTGTHLGFTQTIKVIDKNTLHPLSGCAIHNKTRTISTITNIKGEADISAFKNADSIFFHLMNFKGLVYSYKALEELVFSVEISENTVSLNEVIISSNRWEEQQIEVPSRIEKINKKEIIFQNPQTAADMLETSGYVYIQKSQQAGGSPNLRGFATNRVMLVVDGVRMNNAIFRAGNLQNVISIDANALENAEIIFGPGTVMYGSDAIGGVMDFHTLQPKVSSTGKTLFNGNTFLRYASSSQEKTGHLDFNIGIKKWAFLTSFTFADYDDLRTGKNGNSYLLRPSYVKTFAGKDSMVVNKDSTLQIGSAFSQMNFMQKIMFAPNEEWNISYAFHYSATSNAGRYDRLVLDANNNGVLDNAEWYYGPQKWMMNQVAVRHIKTTKVYDRLRISTAIQNCEESRHDRRFNNNLLRNQTETVHAISLNIDTDKKLSDKVTLFYGAEVVHNKIGSVANRVHRVTKEETPTSTRYPDGATWQAYGVYASLKYKPHVNWIVNAGARYSYYVIKADFDTTLFPFPFTHAENSSGALNGNLGFVFMPLPTWQLYLNGASGFRAPSMDDLGKVFDSQPGTVIVPNAKLKPEYAYNVEIGTVKVIGDFFKIDVSAYYTLLKHAMARRPFQYNGQDSIVYDGQMSQVLAVQNITAANVCGIQAGLNIDFGSGLGLRTTLSMQYGEEQSEDSLIYYPKPHVAPLFGRADLTYKRRKLQFDVYVQYNGKMDYKDLPLVDRIDNSIYVKDENGLPYVSSWYTLNFKAAFYIDTNFSINIGVENIADKLYRPYSSGISAAGRNFIISVRARF
jgi:hemoglobin/transferrin/lactoferrin receptor protein